MIINLFKNSQTYTNHLIKSFRGSTDHVTSLKTYWGNDFWNELKIGLESIFTAYYRDVSININESIGVLDWRYSYYRNHGNFPINICLDDGPTPQNNAFYLGSYVDAGYGNFGGRKFINKLHLVKNRFTPNTYVVFNHDAVGTSAGQAQSLILWLINYLITRRNLKISNAYIKRREASSLGLIQTAFQKGENYELNSSFLPMDSAALSALNKYLLIDFNARKKESGIDYKNRGLTIPDGQIPLNANTNTKRFIESAQSIALQNGTKKPILVGNFTGEHQADYYILPYAPSAGELKLESVMPKGAFISNTCEIEVMHPATFSASSGASNSANMNMYSFNHVKMAVTEGDYLSSSERAIKTSSNNLSFLHLESSLLGHSTCLILKVANKAFTLAVPGAYLESVYSSGENIGGYAISWPGSSSKNFLSAAHSLTFEKENVYAHSKDSTDSDPEIRGKTISIQHNGKNYEHIGIYATQLEDIDSPKQPAGINQAYEWGIIAVLGSDGNYSLKRIKIFKAAAVAFENLPPQQDMLSYCNLLLKTPDRKCFLPMIYE